MAVQVISPKRVWPLHTCVECGALLTYDYTKDIYEGKYIYCPICKTKQLSALDLNYDGVIQDNIKPKP